MLTSRRAPSVSIGPVGMLVVSNRIEISVPTGSSHGESSSMVWRDPPHAARSSPLALRAHSVFLHDASARGFIDVDVCACHTHSVHRDQHAATKP